MTEPNGFESFVFDRLQSPFALSLYSTGDRYSTFLCMLIYQNRNHIINNENNTESRAFRFSSHFRPNGPHRLAHIWILNVFALRLFGWCAYCTCAQCAFAKNLFDQELHFISAGTSQNFYSSLCILYVSRLLNKRKRLQQRGKIIKTDQAHIPNILTPFISFNFSNAKHFDFNVALSADFVMPECAINFCMCDIRIGQKITTARIKGTFAAIAM